MFKKIISGILLNLAVIGVCAQTSQSTFTYVEGPAATYGKSKREKIDVAMCINDPTYAGLKVTGIKAYISTAEGINETSVWMSHELNLENNVNVPDIESKEVTPVAVTLENLDAALLEATFDSPYTLTADPLYIGYTINVDQNTTEAQKKPVILADNINPNGLFLHMSKSVMKWMNYSETVEGVAYILVTLEGNIPEYALDLVGFNPIFTQNDTDFEATLLVSNKGVNTINNVNYKYSYDNGEVYEGYSDLLSGVEPGFATVFNITLPFKGINGAGKHSLQVEITKTNGEKNEGRTPSIECAVNVIPFVPVHRPLVEEYTGLWCGWCPRGFLAMETLGEEMGDRQVIICYHYDDELAVTNETPVYVSGLPKASVDRHTAIDPYYGSYSDTDFGISIDVEDAMTKMAVASIEVESVLEDTQVNVTSNVEFIIDKDEANYEIGYVLICNGLSNPTWIQNNSYSGSKISPDSPLYVLSTWPELVPGLVFNDVAVDASAMFGVTGSLPSSVKTLSTYTNSYSFDIENNYLIQDPEKIVVAAFIIDKTTNEIINSNKCNINSSGIKSIDFEEEIVSREYYDLTGKKVTNPASGLYIMKEYSKSGKVSTSKIFIH